MGKKLMTLALAGTLTFGGASVAMAGPETSNGKGPNTDPGSPALFGLCTAYSNGKGGENGKKNDAPPFRNLAQSAADEGYDTVAEYCADHGATPGPG